jgi:hypothetical protein
MGKLKKVRLDELIEACVSFEALTPDENSNVCEVLGFFSPQRHGDTAGCTEIFTEYLLK